MCGAVERLVVICPNSFKGGWANEIEKHGTGLTTSSTRATRYARRHRRRSTCSSSITRRRGRDRGKQAIMDFAPATTAT